MPICLDCGYSGVSDDFPLLTSDDIVEHYESGGFELPDDALLRVDEPYCPECSSDQISS